MKRVFLYAATSLSALTGTVAAAQPPTTDPQATTVDQAPAADIVVTGSRTISDGSRAPTPVTVVWAAQLEAAAPGTIAQGLNQLPAFRGSRTAASEQTSSASANSDSFINLRNPGAQRMLLLLLDGRRAPPSTVLGAVDTNILPQELVKRVDVVTGDVSATYGSDAVGRIIVSGSCYDADPVDSPLDRPYGAAAKVVVRDPANPAQSIIVSNHHNPIFTPGGAIRLDYPTNAGLYAGVGRASTAGARFKS